MSYSIQPLSKSEHREALLEVWAENLSNDKIASLLAERYAWLYEDSPDGGAKTWLGVHVESGDVIGCGTVIPRRLHVGGAASGGSWQGGMLSDLAVSHQHRTAGPALKILRAVSKGGFAGGSEILYGYPNPKSTPIFKRLRFQLVGQSRDWVKPLRSEWKVRDYIPNRPLAKVASMAVDSAYRAYDWSTWLAERRVYHTDITTHADESFDVLWRRTPPRWITGEKTCAYLNWRYSGFTTSKFSFFRMYSGLRGGELLGYVVCEEMTDGEVRAAELYCDMDRDLELLLFAFCERMRKEGHRVIRLSFLGNERFEQALVAQHFLKDNYQRPFFARLDKPAPKDLQAHVYEEQRWCMLGGDLDI